MTTGSAEQCIQQHGHRQQQSSARRCVGRVAVTMLLAHLPRVLLHCSLQLTLLHASNSFTAAAQIGYLCCRSALAGA